MTTSRQAVKAAHALALLLLLLLFQTVPLNTLAKKRPNFVLIHLDDVGYGDLSFYSQVVSKGVFSSTEKVSRSPNIDRIAREGTAFSSYYASACVCTPSRAGILTGRYPIRTSMFPRVLGPTTDTGLPLDEITIAKWLKEKAGYTTFMVGKWHLGHIAPFLPTYHGFDKWTGMPYSHDYCACPSTLTNTEDDKCRFWDPPCPIMNGTLIIQQPAILNDIIDYFVNAFKEYVDDAITKNAPFFGYYACIHTHHPQFANLGFIGKSAKMGGRPDAYGDAVIEMDDGIGRIIDHLEARKLVDNTYVFITSDNGAANIYGALSGVNSPLRCGKGTTWEGGQRVPFVAWGADVQKGRILHDIVAGMDVFPTISILAGVSMDDYPRIMDGIDFSELLTGKATTGKRDHFLYYSLQGLLDAVRIGNYKVHFGTSLWVRSSSRNIRDCNPPGIIIGRQEKPLVYDLSKDISESYPQNVNRSEIVQMAKDKMRQVNSCTMNAIKSETCDATREMNCYAVPGDKDPVRYPPEPFHPWSRPPRACCPHGYDIVLPDFMDTTKFSCKKFESKGCGWGENTPCNPSLVLFPECRGRAICKKTSNDQTILRECGLEKPDHNGKLCSEGWLVERCPIGLFQCRNLSGTGDVICQSAVKKCLPYNGVAYFSRNCGECGYSGQVSSVPDHVETPVDDGADVSNGVDDDKLPIKVPDGVKEEEPPGIVEDDVVEEPNRPIPNQNGNNKPAKDNGNNKPAKDDVNKASNSVKKDGMYLLYLSDKRLVIIVLVSCLILLCCCIVFGCRRRYRTSIRDRPCILYIRQSQVLPDEEKNGNQLHTSEEQPIMT